MVKETRDGIAIQKNGVIHYVILAGISISATVLGYMIHGSTHITPTNIVVAAKTSTVCKTDNTVYPYIVTCDDGKVYSVDTNGVRR